MGRWLEKFQDMPEAPADTLDTLTTSRMSGDPEPLGDPEKSAIDWNTPPGPPTEPFNQRYMDAIKAGHPVQVWCGVFDEWVYWVRDEQIKKRLRAKGCTLPIYMLSELRAVAGFDAKALRIFHEPKRAFDAVIHPPNAN